MFLNGQIAAIGSDHPRYPASLRSESAPAEFWAAGPLDILDRPRTGFFCSSQCPGAVILKAFDAVTAMRTESQIVIGGFHSPMEWECLSILLRGSQPVIWVPARSIPGMRLKPELAPAFNAGRLLILSPFHAKNRRITVGLAEERNRFVTALADHIFVAHAAPASRTLALCLELLRRNKPVFTVDDPSNQRLLECGAQPIRPSGWS
ncbi:MAG TPA: DNA-processing protein DprA [Bryobacteraceae bacterium]|nr:DNA-processing protein DprA [Bryobacteraceae bacterium]